MKDAFAEVVEGRAERMDALRAYSTAGVRPDCDFFLWKITQRYEDLGELGAELNASPLSGWLRRPTRTWRRRSRRSTPAPGGHGRSSRAGTRTSSSTRS